MDTDLLAGFLSAAPGALPDVDGVLGIRRPPWHAQASCRGMAVELFFPERGEPPDDVVSACESCEVRSECLSAACVGDELGVWAGTQRQERRRLRKTLNGP